MDHDQQNESSIPAGQLDDINIPLVAVSVAFFAALLAVTIVSLQAYIYNYKNAETAAKTVAQDDPQTTLGAILKSQREELSKTGWARDAGAVAATTGATTNGGGPGTTTAAASAHARTIPIDRAMAKVIDEYAAAQRTNATR